MISKDVVDTVLKKFLTLKRMPRYSRLTKAERKKEYKKEKNKTMLLSSAFFVDSWSYKKCTDTFKLMLNDRKHQFVCGLPYQLSIEEGLLDAETVADEMLESDFNELKFKMEYEALWYGNSDGTFFDYTTVSKNRKIKYPMLPDKLANELGNSQFVKIVPKKNGEIRILSADIALMSSKRINNDATAIFINQMLPSKSGRYSNNFVFADTYEGMRTDDQALVIRRLFDEYQCDYLVLDCNGIGLSIFDNLARDIIDPDTGEVYEALSCYNNQEMADRCTVFGAPKVIWSIKASQAFNSDCAYLLRSGLQNGRIRLLQTEYDGENSLKEIRGYNSLSDEDKIKLQMPYVQTTLLIDELTKLKHEENGGKIKLIERSGMRKDRYSSLSYNYYVALQIENKKNKNSASSSSIDDAFIIRPPKWERTVNDISGKQSKIGW